MGLSTLFELTGLEFLAEISELGSVDVLSASERVRDLGCSELDTD